MRKKAFSVGYPKVKFDSVQISQIAKKYTERMQDIFTLTAPQLQR